MWVTSKAGRPQCRLASGGSHWGKDWPLGALAPSLSLGLLPGLGPALHQLDTSGVWGHFSFRTLQEAASLRLGGPCRAADGRLPMATRGGGQ